MNRNAPKAKKQNFDDMKPVYDFSHGERGRYAHLFGESAKDESLVAEFWKKQGFEVQRFDKAETRFSKTPDFRLFRDNRLLAFCEVKTFRHDEWLDRALDQAPPGELAGGLRPDPIYNRISNAVHTAAKQLEGVNSRHDYLNVLVLVNRDKAAKRDDLISVLTGYWDPMHGEFDKTHAAYSEGRIREDKRKIDLYTWLEPSKSGLPECKLYFFGNDASREQVCRLFNLDASKVKVIR